MVLVVLSWMFMILVDKLFHLHLELKINKMGNLIIVIFQTSFK